MQKIENKRSEIAHDIAITREAQWKRARLRGDKAELLAELTDIKNEYKETKNAIDQQIVDIEGSTNPYDTVMATNAERITELTRQIAEQRCAMPICISIHL